MKKTIQWMLYAVLALLVALVPATAFALEEIDMTVGGAAAPGSLAMDKALVFSQDYDFALNDYDTNTIIKLVNVPEGILPMYMVVAPMDLNQAVTCQVWQYTTTWATNGNVVTLPQGTNTPYVIWLTEPSLTVASTATMSIAGGTNTLWPVAGGTITNVTIAITSTPTIDTDVLESGTYLDEHSWGFSMTGVNTNSSGVLKVPTSGKLRLSLIGLDVLPTARGQY